MRRPAALVSRVPQIHCALGAGVLSLRIRRRVDPAAMIAPCRPRGRRDAAGRGCRSDPSANAPAMRSTQPTARSLHDGIHRPAVHRARAAPSVARAEPAPHDGADLRDGCGGRFRCSLPGATSGVASGWWLPGVWAGGGPSGVGASGVSGPRAPVSPRRTAVRLFLLGSPRVSAGWRVRAASRTGGRRSREQRGDIGDLVGHGTGARWRRRRRARGVVAPCRSDRCNLPR